MNVVNNINQNQIEQEELNQIIHLISSGKLTEAENKGRDLVKKYPQSFSIFNLLAVCLAMQNKLFEAVDNFKKTIQIKPDFVEAHFNLGNALRDLEKSDEAILSYKKAISYKNDYAEAYNNLAKVLLEVGKIEESIKNCKEAIKYKSNFAVAYYNLGKAYRDLGEFDEAVKSNQKAIEIDPGFAEAYNNLSNLLIFKGQVNEAISNYARAIKIKPDYAGTYNNLGVALKTLGKFKDAAVNFTKAIQIKPDYAEAHVHLSSVTKYENNHPHIDEMEKNISSPTINNEQKIYLSFGLGKANEDIKNYKKAFDFWLNGNSLRRKTLNYNQSLDLNFFKKLQSIFNENFFKKFESVGVKDSTPIFIVGMPRSGTTLVEQIISNHPKVYGAGELTELTKTIDKLLPSNNEIGFPTNLIDYDPKIFNDLGSNYIKAIKKFSKSSHYITDKMPHNFRWIGLIKTILPNARIIHCKRDSRDNCLSIFKTNFTSSISNEWSFDLKELAIYHNLYTDLMKYWHKLLPGFIYDISYEKLIHNQKKETSQLLEACNLDWNEKCMRFYENKRSVGTASVVQIRKPIYKDSLYSWKKYENQLKPVLEQLQK